MKEDLDKIIEFESERDWKQFHSPKNLAISLSLEAAEALEVFQWSADNNLPEDKKKQLGQELADVYYYLLLLARETGLDIKEEFAKKMGINASKYPIDKAKGSSKKYNEL
ncbi:nucleotide pyrophosphohydrolase [Chloroflexota bacterium]